jgi:hypothetical protein
MLRLLALRVLGFVAINRNGTARRIEKCIKHYICGDPEESKPEPSMNGRDFCGSKVADVLLSYYK